MAIVSAVGTWKCSLITKRVSAIVSIANQERVKGVRQMSKHNREDSIFARTHISGTDTGSFVHAGATWPYEQRGHEKTEDDETVFCLLDRRC